MAGLIPEDIVERIKNESDIVSVISEFVNLKKSGKDYKGLCPFHQEKTPSFYVVPGRGFYHCFGCGKGGNLINFIMEQERLEYPAALRYLADKAGISIPETAHTGSRSERMYDLLAFAAAFFENSLRNKSSKAAAEYLKSRGISGPIARTFGIGYAPAGWDNLIKAASSKRFSSSDLEAAGLAIRKEGYYDRFRNRLMIPIRSISGKVIGFGGRALSPDDTAKYINSPETEVYKKGRVLYGLDISKNDVRSSNVAVVVEGYFDLISLYQSGVRNVVAVSGTGFTAEQASLLARFSEQAVLLYDSDSAGIKAAFRASGVLYGAGVEPRLVRLPRGYDPDSFVKDKGPEELSALIREASDVVDFVRQGIKGRFSDLPLPRQKKVIGTLGELMRPIEDALTRELLSRKLFEKLDIDLKTLGLIGESRVPIGDDDGVRISSGRDRFERAFLSLLLEHSELVSGCEGSIEESLFTDGLNGKIFAAILESGFSGKELSITSISDKLGDEAAARRLREIAFPDQVPSDWEEQFESSLRKFRRISVEKRLDELKGQIGEAEKTSDENRIRELTREFQNLKLEAESNDTRV
jgi:DNA primase